MLGALLQVRREQKVDITIEQNAFSFRSEYEITTPACIYSAKKKFLSWGDKIQVFGPRERITARIRSRFSLFRCKYEFALAEGAVYRFRKKKIWTGVYVCEGPNECFRLYEHKGLNWSVFQNDAQIAAFSKNKVKIGKGDRYEIRMNEDANLAVMICLVLAIDASENEGNNTSVTYDFGQLGPEARPFDES